MLGTTNWKAREQKEEQGKRLRSTIRDSGRAQREGVWYKGRYWQT
jgi:hypothetical protein